jgi:Tol biopolymer transport system component
MRVATDGSGRADSVAVPHSYAREPNPSPDGNWLTYMAPGETGASNLFAVNLETGEDRLILESSVYLHDPIFSPDGRYIAYERTIGPGSLGSGQEIRVREFGGDSDWLVSENVQDPRFWDPTWTPDGKYIYFRSMDAIFRRSVQLEPSFRPLGRIEEVVRTGRDVPFELSPVDGRVLLPVPVSNARSDAPNMYVVQGWFEELKRIAPPEGR